MHLICAVIQEVFKLQSVRDFVEKYQNFLNFSDAGISILAAVFAAVLFFYRHLKKYIISKGSFNRYVDTVYNKEIRKELSKYYIPTRAQDVDPCEYDEIRENNGKFISCNLVPFFINEAFKESSSGQFFLVLADSGMGKTTFLLKLYHTYLKKHQLKGKRKIKLIPLANPDCMEKIKEIPDPENTILLLDALDENREAMYHCNEFLQSLIIETSSFYKIIITCRTHFFPTRNDEPAATGLVHTGKKRKGTEIVKKYISPFSDEEVKKYLKKRYFFKRKMQKEAFSIVSRVPSIMARPLILNWIDDLCGQRKEYQYLMQIYDTIIEKWLDREALENNTENLYRFSLAVSEYMFTHEVTTIPAKDIEEIASRNDILLEPIVAKSRSLLNRNGSGEYRFAHRSFLEYFVAFKVLSDLQMPDNAEQLWNMSGAKRLLFEMLVSSAERSDLGQVQDANEQISAYMEFTNSNCILDFLFQPAIQLSSENKKNGFTVSAWLPFLHMEGYSPNGTANVKDFFANTNGPIHYSTSNTGVDVGLIFDVKRIKHEVDTRLTVKINHQDLFSSLLRD